MDLGGQALCLRVDPLRVWDSAWVISPAEDVWWGVKVSLHAAVF